MALVRVPDKRGTFEICADMLRVLENEFECNRAFLAVNSRVDSRALTKYLDMLLRHGLAQRTSPGGRFRVRISEKGRQYLHQYVKMRGLLN